MADFSIPHKLGERADRLFNRRAGIDAISVSVDVLERTRGLVAAAEKRLLLEHARS